MKKYLLVSLAILVSHIAFSQCMEIEIPLSSRINSSSTIVEGEVISKQSYWDAKHQNIYTVNTIKPFKTFKGTLQNNTTIDVITLGGTVDLTRIDISIALNLNVGDVGMFILKNTPVSLTKPGRFFTTVEGSQGFIKYDKYDASASGGFNRYSSVENQLYQLIESKVGQKHTIIEMVDLFQNNMNRRAGSISGINPTSVNSGVGDILTINGTGFGTTQGQVHFKDSKDGGSSWISTYDSDIISWSTTQIQVKVISRASTGRVRVVTSANETIVNSPTLTINWAHQNIQYDSGAGLSNYENNIIAKDANGGYQFEFAPNFSATNAQASFNRALATWNCGSGVNFESAGSTTVSVDDSDTTNIVMYMTTAQMEANGFSSSTLAYAKSIAYGCDVNGSFQWYIGEIDIVVNSDFNWHYDTGTPAFDEFNFETVVLHELGHAHQLGHVGQENDFMYYSTAIGEKNIILNADNLNGGAYVMNKSTTTSVCNQSVMTPYAGSLCCNDPEITTHPTNLVNCANDTEVFTIVADFASNYQWEVNNGTSWDTITDNTIYSGVQTNTLTVSNINLSMNGYQYRCIASNSCSVTTTSNAATLTADKPEATLTATDETPCDTNDGTITFTFPDNPNRTNIQFSIDGGSAYLSDSYEDNLGSATITNISPGTYTVYSKWGNNTCEVEIGDITVGENNNPEAIVASSTPSNCSSASGSATITWVVDPNRTHIEFSTDGGISYPHITTNPAGTITIGNLPNGITDLWVRWGNDECPIDMEDVAIGNSNCDFSNGFVTTWKTDNTGTSNDNSITIPIASTGTYNYHVDWGDGQVDYNVSTSITHSYASPNTYTVKIIGDFPRIYFNNSGDKNKILSVEQWGTISWTSMEFSFFGCSNLEINATDIPDLSNVTSMRRMLQGVSSLNEYVNLWDVSSVTNMGGLFWNVTSFNQDISNWNVENVTTMNYMFNSASSFNQDISSWDVSNVNNTYNMFEQATSFNQNLGTWDISSCTDMSNMFNVAGISVANYDKTLIGWNTLGTGETQIPTNINFHGGNSKYCNGASARANLINTHGWSINDNGLDCSSTYFKTKWQTTTGNETITIPTIGTGYSYDVDWDNDGVFDDLGVTANATHIYTTAGTHTVAIRGDFPRIYFNNSGNKNKILSIEQWGTGAWSSMNSAFYGCSKVEVNALDVPDLSNATSMFRMFRGATSFNQYIGNWDVSTITNMEQAFLLASAFNQDINGWNVSNVVNMNRMFGAASAFNQDLSDWNVSNVNNMAYMFASTIVFNGDIGSWDVSSVTNMEGLFSSTTLFDQDISAWDVSNVITMESMFKDATAFNQDISTWDVSNVTNMFSMFFYTPEFNQNLGAWDISSVNNMLFMFTSSTLSVANYDNTLIGWNNLDTIPQNISFTGGNSKYCIGASARANLINTHGWSINDNGLDCSNAFITSWKTDNIGTSNDNSITIPIASIGTYNYNVDWGDGEIDYNVNTSITHSYASPSTYTVKILGDFPQIQFAGNGDHEKIVSIEQWGTQTWQNMDDSFWGCFNLVINATDIPDLSQVTSFSRVFRGATSMNHDMSLWDVSTVTNMDQAFMNAYAFNSNIVDWDVENVTTMNGTFYDATVFNQDISDWDVVNVINMNNMFRRAMAFNQDIGNWNVSNVGSMNFMFATASSFDQNLGNWDIVSMNTMTTMFFNSGLSVSNYDDTLIGWNTIGNSETQIPTGVNFAAGNSKYCVSEAARTNLINTHGWSINDLGSNCAVVSPKVILQGAALNPNVGEEMLMRDDLRVAGLLPTTTPYADAITVNTTVFNTGGALGTGTVDDDIVDWVYVELRDIANNSIILIGQSALLQRDGDVVAIDGVSNVAFKLGADNYYVTIKHRNHLGIMTANSIALDASAPIIDFTNANNQITFGTNAQSTFGMPINVVGMWAGDSNGDGQLNYSGGVSDVPSIRSQVFNDPNNSVFGGPPVASYQSIGYYAADVNMNGLTIYSGGNSDVLNIRNNIFNNPSNSVFGGPPSAGYLFTQQLPEGSN